MDNYVSPGRPSHRFRAALAVVVAMGGALAARSLLAEALVVDGYFIVPWSCVCGACVAAYAPVFLVAYLIAPK